jgi:diketogulonate reductase-like aldo/keto reductase
MLSEGRARAVGVSNFSEQHLENLMQRTDIVPAVNQVELHPFFTQRPLREFHARHGIATEAWSPLGGIQVYRPADPDAVLNALEHPVVASIAEKHGKTPAQVVLRWHVEHGVVAIPKSVRPHRIRENIDIFDFALTAEEVVAIDALDTGVRGGPDPESINTTTYPKTVENDR